MRNFLRSMLKSLIEERQFFANKNSHLCVGVPDADVARGDFHIDYNECLDCWTCAEAAPNNIRMNENGATVLVKQPTSRLEVDQIIEAMRVCCVQPIHYSGNDPYIIETIRKFLPRDANKVICRKRTSEQ